MLEASLDAVVTVDEIRRHHRVQSGRGKDVRLAQAGYPRQGRARYADPGILPARPRDGRRISRRSRRADDRQTHRDRDPERRRRDLSRRADRARRQGLGPASLPRLHPRPARKAASRGRDQQPARKTAPKREDGGDGFAAGRRFARAEQPAGGRRRAVDPAARICPRSADQDARRKGPRRRRAVRPHRQELPRHGAASARQPGSDRSDAGGASRARSDRLRRAQQRHHGREPVRRRALSW